MAPSRMVASLLSLVAIFAIVPGAMIPAASAHAGSAERSDAPPQLEQSTAVEESLRLHSIAEGFTGGAFVEVPRRLASARRHVPLRLLTDTPAEIPDHAALLKLRDARRGRLAIRALVALDVSGAASFHTGTRPPGARR